MDHSRQEIINRIFEHSEAMKRGMYTHMQAYFHHLPVTRSQLEVLSAIKYLQPVSFKEIARQLYLTPGAVSQSVEALNLEGYVLREADLSDRRIQHLKLSSKGEKLLHDIENRRRALMEEALKDLTFDELALWLKVQTNMSKQFQAVHLKADTANLHEKKETK